MSRLLPIYRCEGCRYIGRLEPLLKQYCCYGGNIKEIPNNQIGIPDWCPLEKAPESKLSVKGKPVEIDGKRAAIYDTVGYSKEVKDEPNT